MDIFDAMRLWRLTHGLAARHEGWELVKLINEATIFPTSKLWDRHPDTAKRDARLLVMSGQGPHHKAARALLRAYSPNVWQQMVLEHLEHKANAESSML